MAERESSFSELKARQSKIVDSITKTARVAGAIGTSNFSKKFDLTKPSADYLERAVKVGEIKDSLINRATPTLRARLEEVSRQIEADVQNAIARVQLETIKDQVKRGLLPESALKTAQQVVDNLSQSLDHIEPPETKKTQEDKERELPKIIIDRERDVITIGDRQVKIQGKINKAVLMLLAKHAPESVSHKIIAEAAKKAGSRSKIYVAGQAVDSLRRFLELNGVNPQLIITTGRSRAAAYCLRANVEFVGESQKSKKYREAHEFVGIPLPDGQKVIVQGKVQARLIESILESMSRESAVYSDDLSKKLYGASTSRGLQNLRLNIRLVRALLLRHRWQVIHFYVDRRRGHKGKYYLEKIEEKKKEVQEFPSPEKPEKLAALNLFLDNPNATAEEILEVFGPKTKKGSRLLTHQLVWGLTGIINRLSYRKLRGLITEEESKTLERASNLIGGIKYEHPRTDLMKFRRVVEARFGLVLTGEAVQEDLITDEQALVLAVLLNSRRDLIREVGIEEFPDENAQEIISSLLKKVNGKVTVSADRLLELRGEVINKVITLAKSDKENIIENQSPEVQTMILYFMINDNEPVAKLLQELLTAPIETTWEHKKWGGVGRVWKEAVVDAKKIVVRPPKHKSKVQDGGKTSESADVSKPHKEKPEKPKTATFSIEKADPDVRKEIRSLLTRLDDQHIAWPLKSSQAAKVDSRLTVGALNKASENHYVSPKRGKDQRRLFQKDEVALLIYLKDYGNGLTPKQLKELRRIIAQEMSKQPRKKK